MTTNADQRGLTSERLQMFVAGLSGIAPEEVRKAKLLLIKNEVAQLRAIKESQAGFGAAQGCLAIIPIFWPVIWAQRSGMKASVRMHADQIRNALSVWRDDLGAEGESLEKELESLQVD